MNRHGHRKNPRRPQQAARLKPSVPVYRTHQYVLLCVVAKDCLAAALLQQDCFEGQPIRRKLIRELKVFMTDRMN